MIKDSLNQDVNLKDILIVATDRTRLNDFLYVIETREDGCVRVAPLAIASTVTPDAYQVRMAGNKKWVTPRYLVNVMPNLKESMPSAIDSAQSLCEGLVVESVNTSRKSMYCILSLNGSFYSIHGNDFSVSGSEQRIFNAFTELHTQVYGNTRIGRSFSMLNSRRIFAGEAHSLMLFESNNLYAAKNNFITSSQFKKIFGYTKDEPGCSPLTPSEIDQLNAWYNAKTGM